MWIVVVVEPYYPSIFHFNNEAEARVCYEKNKNDGKVTHLAVPIKSNYNEELYEFDVNDPETLDVEWYISR